MAGLTIDDPVTLRKAATSDAIIPGDTLLLRGGTYTGDFIFAFTGNTENAITIKAYPGERVIINGKVTTDGNALRFENLEFAYLDWATRETLEEGSSPSDIPDKSVDINTSGCKFINCIFHNLSGLGLWTPATTAEFYGCIIYHNGWSAPDRGHGHGLYTQNDTMTKTIRDCIIFDCFGWGIHAYTSSGKIDNFIFDGCVCFRAGSLYGAIDYNNILIGGLVVANNITVRDCMTYGAGGVNIGYNAGAANVTLTDNYFPDGITKVNTTPAESGNYYGPAVGNQVFLRVNSYDATRANLTIYNGSSDNTIEVDVSAIYANGTQIQARNVQDYFSDIQTLTVTAGKVTINMQAANRTVAAPIGWTSPATTFPQFGCFVLDAS